MENLTKKQKKTLEFARQRTIAMEKSNGYRFDEKLNKYIKLTK